MTKREAYIVARMFYRLGEQIDWAFLQGRSEDAYAMNRLMGRLEYRIFEGASCYGVEYDSLAEAIADRIRQEAA